MTRADPDSRLGPELVRLILSQTFLHACMAGTRMAAPLMALREGSSQASVGVLLSLFALGSLFLALPAGRFADRHGLKRPVAVCVITSMTGAGAAVLWPTFWVLCFSALTTGAASVVASIALQRHVGRIAHGPAELRQAFSWLSIGPAISNFIGSFLAGLMIDHAGFRAAFFLLMLLPLGAWLWVRRSPDHVGKPALEDGTQGTAWSLVRVADFRRLMLLNWAVASCWDLHTFMVPVLGHERGLSASVIGFLLGAFAVAAAFVRLVLPIVASRAREWYVIAGACAGSMVALLVYPLVHHPLAMGACSVVLGSCLGVVQPMVMSLLHQVTPEHRHGEAIGMRQLVIQGSSVSMPLVFGAAGAALGVTGVFWIVGCVVGSGIWLSRQGERAERLAGRDRIR